MKKLWIAAIQYNIYVSWPGLDEYMVCQHLEVQEPSILGHLNAQRLGTQTKRKKERKRSRRRNDMYPSRKQMIHFKNPSLGYYKAKSNK